MTNSQQANPLQGVVVLDFSRVLAGPFCSALLADLGATVIKVEPPQGDDQRHMGAMRNGHSINFAQINRSKRSICLDLKQPEALKIARDLAKKADVVLENYRPGVAERIGIDYATLSALNPSLIYCSISGFGQDGPFAKRPSYDVIAQAMSGFMSVTGPAEGEPVFAGDSIGDTVSGLFGAWAISTALFRRERDGFGQHLDVAMFDSLMTLLPTAVAQYQKTGTAPGRSGHIHPLTAPFGAFRAKDGRVIIAVANSALFARLCNFLDLPGLVEDPRFASDADRRRNEADLRTYIENWSTLHTVQETVAMLGEAGVPASPVWDIAEAVESKQSTHRALFHEVTDPCVGQVKVPRQPVHFSATPPALPAPAPEIGADGADILAEMLDMDASQISDLRARNIV